LFSLKNDFPEYYRFHGRKITKKISPTNLNLLKKYYDKFSLDKEIIKYHQQNRFNQKLFFSNKKFNKINVEIGFGDGEFLLNEAVVNPSELYIGVEVYLNGISKVLQAIIKLGLKNVLLCNLNCIYFLTSVKSKSIDKIYIINPDPWNKKRHNKRRLLSYENIKLLNNLIKTKSCIYITTDSKIYFEDIKKQIYVNDVELYKECEMRTLSTYDKLYGVSKYQRKAIEIKGKIYLISL